MSTNNRPLSPHIQVYRWQFTMVLSILHRATGAGLALGAVLMAWWLMAAITGVDAFAQFHDFTHSLIGQLMLAGWVWAFVFHFLNGIRHLVWDTGHGFTIKGASRSGQVVFLLSLVFAALVWVAAWQKIMTASAHRWAARAGSAPRAKARITGGCSA